jgi:rare lipoprotein A
MLLLLGLCLLQGACSSLPKGELSLDAGIKDRGVASWYGQAFHGKLAANGEAFDMTAYTAAHRKLPLGSTVRVLNVENGKWVDVRITDRGPYVIGRMLDLSQAAAQALDMVDRGTAAIQLEVIGAHRRFVPVPDRQWASLTGLVFRRDSRPTSTRSPKGIEPSRVALRIRPQEALSVRRERRHGSALAADHLAHSAVPGLLVS